ncbi:hypothetical protein K3495_g4348 [Podosphaera aphanis]|nr:hypothetical protein K3495_g4348 [Podosphaera aphanis]
MLVSSLFILTFIGLTIAQSPSSTMPAHGSSPETGALGNASIVENNPPGTTYAAFLPSGPDKINGSVYASANPDGIGVRFDVKFSNLPLNAGPLIYHLHVAPVPSDGNCNGALGHLDPFLRGEATTCNKMLPQTCQVGDLSGKHGKVTTDPYTQSYTDPFASTFEGIGAFFGNRSLVVHFANKTRITCANFTLFDPTAPMMNSTATFGNGSSSPIPFTGSSSRTIAVSTINLIASITFLLCLFRI